MEGNKLEDIYVNVTLKVADLTMEKLLKALEATSNKIGDAIKSINEDKNLTGKVSQKTLIKSGNELSNVRISAEDLKGVQKALKENGVRFSVNKGAGENYNLRFEAKSTEALKIALEDYVAKKENALENGKKEIDTKNPSKFDQLMEKAKEKADKTNAAREVKEKEKAITQNITR